MNLQPQKQKEGKGDLKNKTNKQTKNRKKVIRNGVRRHPKIQMLSLNGANYVGFPLGYGLLPGTDTLTRVIFSMGNSKVC